MLAKWLIACSLAATLCQPPSGPQPAAARDAWPARPSAEAAAVTASFVQLFDVAQGRVIRSVPNSMSFRRLGESWIASIRSAWGGFRLDPESGYVLKVPFEPVVRVSNNWYRGEVRELFIMWDPKAPHDTRMMLTGAGGSPRMFIIKADAGSFVERFKNGQGLSGAPEFRSGT
ncbi:hypothetical protein [Paenibacillus sp. GYB003]|uniref:hypothetical protein n=1 Tax=Paenibacillus sp. GYB003 TaxID=2994392 RepID=UPI002F96D418